MALPRSVLLALVLCLASESVLAQPGGAPRPLPIHGPAGWQGNRDEGFVPPGLGERQFYALVVPALERRVGSLNGLLEAAQAALAEAGTFTPGSAPAQVTNPQGWEMALMGGAIEKEGQRLFALILGARKGQDEGIVVVIADSQETLDRHADAFALFARSIGAAAPPKPEAKPDPGPAPPPAEAASLVGRWGTSTGRADALQLGGLCSTRRQYHLKADGTYTYHAEYWGGTLRSDWWWVVDEQGKWSVSGNQLTIAPTSAGGEVRNNAGEVQERHEVALEKVSYAWELVYFSGIGETQLVIKPPAKTKRDGAFASNSAYPNTYMLSNTYKPEWQHKPPE